MAAGLPGVGLSGLFFIVSALLMVPIEIVRTVRGRSSPARWAVVARHFATAVVMVASLELFYVAIRFAVRELSSLPVSAHGVLVGANPVQPAGRVVKLLPILPVLMTGCLVLSVLGIAKAAELVSRARHSRGVSLLPRHVP